MKFVKIYLGAVIGLILASFIAGEVLNSDSQWTVNTDTGIDSSAIGLLIGLVGLLAGLAVMVAVLSGFFNRFLVVRPQTGVSPAAGIDLLNAILRLNEERRPWGYRPTPDDRRADFVAEWKLADARWWGAFNRNGMRRSYRAFVTLNEGSRELRITEELSSVNWSMGLQGLTPSIHWGSSFFKGVILFQRTKEIAYGIKDELPLQIGDIYKYDFDPWRVKAPLVRLAIENGWSYCPAVHKFQLGSKSIVLPWQPR